MESFQGEGKIKLLFISLEKYEELYHLLNKNKMEFLKKEYVENKKEPLGNKNI